MSPNATRGKVYLVGAGPGDPGLITQRGLECIRAAQTLVYDYLAAPELLRHARPDAEMLYVGKKGGDHTLGQEAINRLLVEKAGAGRVVVRLKGGDPFIFGRGGEEAEALVAAGIDFEVVPGVTSAVAAAAYAGIPLTHRHFTSTLAFVTGHEDPTKDDTSIDWAALAQGVGTLVFYMGVKNLPHIVERLMAHGRAAETPVALVRWGTTARQRTVGGTLADIVSRVAAAGLKAPCIIVIGEVVRLRDTLQWFERRPLFGRRIVVTRAREQASGLVARLHELGAQCFECPGWWGRRTGVRPWMRPSIASRNTNGSYSPASTGCGGSSNGSLTGAAMCAPSAESRRRSSGRQLPNVWHPSGCPATFCPRATAPNRWWRPLPTSI